MAAAVVETVKPGRVERTEQDDKERLYAKEWCGTDRAGNHRATSIDERNNFSLVVLASDAPYRKAHQNLESPDAIHIGT